jgi:hypothetical protein
MASKGADGRRPVSGGGVCGLGKTKGRWGIAFLPHEKVLAGEKAAGGGSDSEDRHQRPNFEDGSGRLGWRR